MAVKAVKASCPSSLNPHAPHFVPSYFEVVDDFSPEWWQLVKSSPAFCDFWIRERWEISPLDNLTDFEAVDILSDGDEDFEEDVEELDEEEPAELPPQTLKEQDLNLFDARKPRLVKMTDLVPPPPDHLPRDPRHKIVQVPPKLAASQARKASLKCRIQQPR